MNYRGIIAAIMAGGLTLTLVIGVTGAVWQGHFPLGNKGGEVLVGIFVAMATAITAYMATKNGQ